MAGERKERRKRTRCVAAEQAVTGQWIAQYFLALMGKKLFGCGVSQYRAIGTEATGQQSLANQLAYLLPFAEVDKIDLLQLDDPLQRLDATQALLDGLQGELFA